MPKKSTNIFELSNKEYGVENIKINTPIKIEILNVFRKILFIKFKPLYC